jgi:S1-C subfamily serine protease
MTIKNKFTLSYMNAVHLFFTASTQTMNPWRTSHGALLRLGALVGALLAWHLSSLAQDPPVPAPAITTPPNVSWGTGFVVAEGFLLTAHHVVKDKPMVLVGPVGLSATGKPRWVLAQVVHSDPAVDLALLKAKIDLPVLALHAENVVPLGLEISVIGYPQPRIQGMSKKITQGIINGYRNDSTGNADKGYMQISAEVSQGNSGGPVLAPDGTVVGMVQRKLNAPKIAERTQDLMVNVNYALRSSLLIQFLQNSPATPRQQNLSLDKVLRPYQLYEQTQSSVLAVMGRGSTP